jgi:hypothetical protein
MIKLDHVFSREFTQEVVLEYVRPNLKKEVESFFKSYDSYLSKGDNLQVKHLLEDILSTKNLHELTFSRFVNLKAHIYKVYTLLPVLCEKYCPEIFFKNLKINENLAEVNITPVIREELFNYRDDLMVDLASFGHKRMSVLLPLIQKQLFSATKASDIKSVIQRVVSLKNGNLWNATELETCFPKWVYGFGHIFKYETISKKFRGRMVDSIDAKVCLFCNQESIEPIEGKKKSYSPDLDHFYPQSKFPFLATSIYNLLPTGSKCNQRFKTNYISLDLVNPYEGGVCDAPLFKFGYENVAKLDRNDLDIEVISNNFDRRNIDLFELDSVYNGDSNKKAACDLINQYGVYKEFGVIKNLKTIDSVNDLFHIDLKSNPKSDPLRKLRVDALNHVSNDTFPFEVVD